MKVSETATGPNAERLIAYWYRLLEQRWADGDIHDAVALQKMIDTTWRRNHKYRSGG